MTHLLDLSPAALSDWLSQQGQPVFRGRQIRQWLFRRGAADFAAMSDLPQGLRAALAEQTTLWSTRISRHHVAADGTEKLLLALDGGGQIECVLLKDGPRRTICISSQVGCAMGCVFCASGLDGVERNLTTGEIVEQMLRLRALLPAEERLSHIVVMGMGEPLANLGALLPALDVARDKQGLGISPRRITISTVGLPRQIERLAEMQAKYNLAVSLHAPDDGLRNQLVKVNQQTGLTAILAAADRYFEASGRRLTFEYALLAGINDQPQHARRLAKLLKGRPMLLNVIPYNPVAGLPYATPRPEAIRRFREVLEAAGLTVKFRQRKGDEIDAACGQLRRSSPNLPLVTLETSEPPGVDASR